jgi:hypothetical protein
LGPRNGNPPLVQVLTTGINNIAAYNKMVMVTCFPNPTENEVALQYYLYEPANMEITFLDMSGKIISHKTEMQSQAGLYSSKLYLDGLPAGNYLLSIKCGNNIYSRQIIKAK